MKEEILNLKEKVLKTYSSKSRHTLKMMSKKFRKIDNFNLSLTIPAYSKKTSTGSKRTSKFNLVLQIQKSCLGKNRFKSIPQNPGEILRQFSSVKENELSPYKEILTKTVKVILEESPHILIK
jgi:hypothetical protein